jgi:Flp pilus assembly protein TadG
MPRMNPRRRGVSMVEAAVTLPVCILLSMVVLEFGRFQMVRHVVGNAATVGARRAAIGAQRFSTSALQDDIRSQLACEKLPDLDVLINRIDSQGNPDSAWAGSLAGETISVQIRATYRAMIPTLGIIPAQSSLAVTTLVRCEQD